MEQFFTPIRRRQERWEQLDEEFRNPTWVFNEVELTVPIEEFLSYRWDWEDLCTFVTADIVNKTIWITEDAFLAIASTIPFYCVGSLHDPTGMIANVRATSGQERLLILQHLDHSGISFEEASVFWRAITTSNCNRLTIESGNRTLLPSGPFLSQFLRESPSLEVLRFQNFDFKEEHCLALMTLQRTDLEVELYDCSFQPQDAEDAFIEWFRHNKLVTELDSCHLDFRIISALSGNKSVKRLTIDRRQSFGEEKMNLLLQALSGNIGIDHLKFRQFVFSDESWVILFRTLATHPLIKRVYLEYREFPIPPSLPAASKSIRMKAVLHMLHLNTWVDTVELAGHFRDDEMYQNSILPRLWLHRNWFEVERLAVKRADTSIRPQLLGRALHAVRYNPDLVFEILSENVPVFVRTEEEDSSITLQNDPATISG